MLSPAAIKAYVAAALLALAFGSGWAVNGWRLTSHTATAQVKAVEHVAVVEHAQVQVTAAVEASAVAAEAQTQVVYRTINHEVIRYVQSPAPVCTLDPEWVRIYNGAATAAIPNGASDADAASAPHARDAPGADKQLQRGFIGDGGQLPDIPASPPAA